MRSKAKIILQLVIFLSVVFLLAKIFSIYAYSLVKIEGKSMEPSYEDGTYVIVKKWGIDNIEASDVIVFRHPRSEKLLVKRVVAQPETELFIENFKLYINNKPIEESDYVFWDKSRFECKYSEVYKVPRGHVFLMGDNRCESMDSRNWGPIGHVQIVGQVIYAF